MLHENISCLFLKPYVICFVEKNYTWINTSWGSWKPWEPCKLKEDCGNGYRFRRRKCYIYGANNKTTNDSMCGVPPLHMQSCYKMCHGKKLVFSLVHQDLL